MDKEELSKPFYKITVDDFFERSDKKSRVIICDELWKYDIVTKVFTRMGKRKNNGYQYRYNDGTDNLVDDDYRPWRQCCDRLYEDNSCCLDNCGGWGTINDYKYPSNSTFERWGSGSHQMGGIMGPQEPTAHYDGGLTGNAARYYGLIRDGYWRPTEGCNFERVDFSKYLTPDEVELIKEKLGFDPMFYDKNEGGFRRIKPSECIGSEEEENEKRSLLKNVGIWSAPVVTKNLSKITIQHYFDLGEYGGIRIRCKEPWQAEILKTVYERMGQDTGFFAYTEGFPCSYGPGGKKIIDFEDVYMADYLTLEEVKQLASHILEKRSNQNHCM